jgi:hypothetical protein
MIDQHMGKVKRDQWPKFSVTKARIVLAKQYDLADRACRDYNADIPTFPNESTEHCGAVLATTRPITPPRVAELQLRGRDGKDRHSD